MKKERTVVPLGKAGDDRRDEGRRHRRAVQRRGPRQAAGDRARGEGSRRDRPARRGVQAADVAVRVPGTGRGGAEDTSPRRASKTGLAIVTEVMSIEQIPACVEYADVLQIGARNMQNFNLLSKVGETTKPVLLKRGMSATLEEFLLAAEYIMARGNHQVILCERGIRTFEDYVRNTLPLAIVPELHARSHLPVVVDPSHGTGKRDLVDSMCRASVACGADGLILEVHNDPEHAMTDGAQSLTPQQFADDDEGDQADRAGGGSGGVTRRTAKLSTTETQSAQRRRKSKH